MSADFRTRLPVIPPAPQDRPDRLVCAPDVAEMLKEMSETSPAGDLGVIPGLLGIPVIIDETMKEHEWKAFSGEKLLTHCFPNPYKDGEMIVFKPPVFDLGKLEF